MVWKRILVAGAFAGLAALLLMPAFLLHSGDARQSTPGEPAPVLSPEQVEAQRAAWTASFKLIYALEPGQAVKLIKQPYPACRAVVQENPQTPMLLHWSPESQAQVRGTFSREEGYYLEQLLEHALHVPMSEMAGDRQYRLLSVPGDFIFREGAAPEQVIADLVAIFREQTGMPLVIEFREVELETYVLRGTWKYKPIPGAAAYAAKHGDDPKPQVHLYAFATDGDRWDPYNWLEGRNNLALALASRFQTPVVMEAAGVPALTVYNHDERETGYAIPEIHDPPRTLAQVTEQTGLTWAREKRRHRRLVVDLEGH